MTDSRRSAHYVYDVSTAPGEPILDARFRESYDAHFSAVLRLLRRLGVDAGDLEDVCHDVFMVFMKRLSEIEDPTKDRAYLFAVAYRTAADFRKLSRHKNQPMPEAGLEPGGAHPEELYALRNDLARALAQLPDDRRAVLVFHELEGLGVPEIAEITNTPLNTVYSRLRLARVDFERVIAEAAEVAQ